MGPVKKDMNLILLFPEDFLPGTNRVRLQGRRQQHVLAVHKAQEGDELCVGLVNNQLGHGTVVRLDEKVLEMEVAWQRDPPPAFSATLILSLPRPSVLKRVLLTATSMGIKKIYLINSYRVEKTFWKSHAVREDEIREQLVLGLEQAKDTVLPEVHLRPKFKPFVEDELSELIKGNQCYLAHPEGRRCCPCQVKQPFMIAVGPEGGFIPFEVEKFLALGFEPIHLGKRILRVESAVPALLGRLG